MKTIAQKCVVITGAGSGIGRALALYCAKEGAHLALCDISPTELTETSRLLQQTSVRVIKERVDVSDLTQMEKFARTVAHEFGAADVVINNAGISFTQMAEHMTKSEMEQVMNVNFWGVVHGCMAFLPQLQERPEAHIVNISSLLGLIPLPSQSAYVASKFAVRGYTETLTVELAHTRVGVSCVFPGGVKTNIVRNGHHLSTTTGLIDEQRMRQHFDYLARTTPERAARQIMKGVLARKARIVIGADAKLWDLCHRMSPGIMRRILIAASRMMGRAVEEQKSQHAQAS